MIDCSGLVVVPQNAQLKEIETGTGYYLDFNVVAQERKHNSEKAYHRYRANMWVPKDKIDEWRTKLVPGTVLKFGAGQWAAEEKDGSKYPMNVLKLEFKRVEALKTPMWLE